jgi:hypothetical protein
MLKPELLARICDTPALTSLGKLSCDSLLTLLAPVLQSLDWISFLGVLNCDILEKISEAYLVFIDHSMNNCSRLRLKKKLLKAMDVKGGSVRGR